MHIAASLKFVIYENVHDFKQQQPVTTARAASEKEEAKEKKETVALVG
jgi:hypothetical protein